MEDLQLNIFVLHGDLNPSKLPKEICKNKYKKSIVLLTFNENTYFTVGRKVIKEDEEEYVETLFENNDSFIKKLFKKACK